LYKIHKWTFNKKSLSTPGLLNVVQMFTIFDDVVFVIALCAAAVVLYARCFRFLGRRPHTSGDARERTAERWFIDDSARLLKRAPRSEAASKQTAFDGNLFSIHLV